MPGYLQDRTATGVLDPLLAKTIVLTHGSTTLAIVALDLIGLERAEVEAVRKAVGARTGIAGKNIFIHATHTHTGAMVPRRFTSDAESIYPGLFPGRVDPKWIASLPASITEAVANALAARRSVGRVTHATGHLDSIAFYRRFLMKDGTVRTNPGRGNPDIVRPAGSIDPTVHVLEFGGTNTMLVSYGLHPDCIGGTMYSADYPAHLTESIRAGLGPDWNVLYLNAACGNINHIDVGNPAQRSSYEESRRIGQALAAAVLAARPTAREIRVDSLDARTRTIRSPLRKIAPEATERARRELDLDAARRNFNEFFAPGAWVLSRTRDKSHPAELSVLRIGPIGIVGFPAETFVENGRAIQSSSPLSPTLVIGLTGGAMGYLPHEEGYRQGGYEAGYRSARYDPRTPSLWIRAALDLLKKIR